MKNAILTTGHNGVTMQVAWIVGIHVRDDAIDGYVPLPARLDLVARMGGALWCTTRDRFGLARPARRDPAEVARALQRHSARA